MVRARRVENERTNMPDTDSDDSDAGIAPPPNLLAQHLSSLTAQADCSDDEDDGDGSGKAPAGVNAATAPASSSSAASACALSAAAADNAENSKPSQLPSADAALESTDGREESFLHIDGPEFDASKGFKPPPTTHADLLPVVDDRLGVGGGSRRSAASSAEPAEQRYHPEENFGVAKGQVRLRGSVCLETDDERGRRVRYGAHQMLKADPWSDCNPNRPMKRGKH